MSSVELLKNLLILQHEAVKALVTEFHQHTEAYVQQFGRLPLAQEPAQAAHDARIPLRSSSLAKSVKTVEDRVHALFVLNASFDSKKMLARFEGKQGYALLVEWFAEFCSYADDAPKGFSELLLRVLQRNVPTVSFTTKTVLKSLSQYKKMTAGKDNKALLQTVLNQYRDKITQTTMEGYLDHLETIGHVGMHKKVWTRRFFKLNATFGVLEFFNDEMQQERKGKLELCGAVVSTADELGELLSDSKSAVEKTRRFIFQITEDGSKNHHHLCADVSDPNAPPSQAYAQASFSRAYLDKWLHALRAAIAAQEDSSLSSATMGLGELNAQIGAFMNHMHLSARISGRVHANGKSIYEITVKAWILERELVMDEDDQEDYRSYGHGSPTAELQNFDGQLRLLFGSKMQNIAFPSSSIGTKLQQLHLHASASQKETENLQRMQVYDVYLQSLLRLPAFSSFSSDASTMLDTFLDVSPHLASFRKLEKKSGQSMHLRDRKVVPWKDRARFEVIYNMHLQVIAAQEEKTRRAESTQSQASQDFAAVYETPLPAPVKQSQDFAAVYETPLPAPVKQSQTFNSIDVTPLPAPVKLTAAAEEARPGESVKQRIARIGQRLVIEAFEA
uniref:PH domain-containing protein n=1 Tax=Phytophthora ramorum TaxID=164328 RepID=H3HCY5_PHYRM